MTTMLTTKEMTLRSGATYRQLDYWTRQGVLTPVIPASGTGTRRAFSQRQVRVVRMVADLARLGATEPVLKAAARDAELLPADYWWGMAYVTEDGTLGRVPASSCWAIDLGHCADDSAAIASQMVLA